MVHRLGPPSERANAVPEGPRYHLKRAVLTGVSALIETLARLRRKRMVVLPARALVASLGVTAVTFFLIRLIPGDPVDLLLAKLNLAAEARLEQAYRETLGLDGTLLDQAVRFGKGLLHGDLGVSLVTGQTVNSIVARTLPVTLWLVLTSIVMASAIAIPLAIAVVLSRRPWVDRAFRIGSSISLATPGFYLGLMLILLFALRLDVAPVAGYQPGFPNNLQYLWLPALTICGALVPILSRVLASSLSLTYAEEYVEAAITRGLPRRIIITRYLLRPSIAPTLSLMSYIVGQMLAAAVVVEIVFNIPGIGTALIAQGFLQRDYGVVQGIVLVLGLIVVVVNFATEALNAWIDPRTRVT